MTRDEHLQWAKGRALKYVDEGDLVNALASFASDIGKHDEIQSLATDMLLASMGTHAAMSNDDRAMRRLIEGFN